MNRITSSVLALAAVPLLATATASAALFGPLDFETSDQFTDNFYLGYTAGSATSLQTTDPSPANNYLRMQGSGSNGAASTISLNRSTDAKSWSNSDRFGNSFTLHFDFATNQSDASFALHLFDPSSPGDNLFVRINTSYSANETVQFRRDGSFTVASGTPGSGFTTGVTANSGTLSTSGTVTITGDFLTPANDAASGTGEGFIPASLSYHVNPGVDTGATLTLSLGSFSATLALEDDTHVIDNPAIAFHNITYNVSNVQHAWRIDNISVVPEPTLMGLLPAAGLLAMRRRRMA